MTASPVSVRNLQPRLDLLKPDLKGTSEARKSTASLTRLVFAGIALILWTMVGLKVWEIAVVVDERRPDEIEKVRVTKEIEDLQAILSKVPERVRLAREDLYAQVDWSERLVSIRNLVTPGSGFATYKVEKSGQAQVSGFARDPAVYGSILDRISEVDFVTAVKSASMTYDEQGYYEFQIVFDTVPSKDVQ